MRKLVEAKTKEMFDGEDSVWIEMLGEEVTLAHVLALPDNELLDVLMDMCTTY
jgi:ethanolamine utilization microcompartment shell protein EutS